MKNLSNFALRGYILVREKDFSKRERIRKYVLCTYLTTNRLRAEIYRSITMYM